MMQAEEPDFEQPFPIQKKLSSPPPRWLKSTRIACAVGYIVIVLTYLIFMIVCIVLYPRCEPAVKTPWWTNGVFLRFPKQTSDFRNLTQQFDSYRDNFTMQAMWLGSPLRSSPSSPLNLLDWYSIDMNLGNESDLNALITKAHENDIRILVDYPLNQFSIESERFLNETERLSYFIWNEQGNTSNWMSVDYDQQSAWTFDSRKNSFYFHQFGSVNQSIDVNYRNNRVLNDLIHSIQYWNEEFNLDGFNLQGISYAYEDFEIRNEIYPDRQRTRHLEEDYLLLARIRLATGNNQLLLLDSIDSLHTNNESILARYYGDKDASLGGVQMLATNAYAFMNENTNLTLLFDRYFHSIYREQERSLLWTSHVFNSTLNEAFFAACLFHTGAIAINIDEQKQQLSSDALHRLRQLMKFTRTLDVFRVGTIHQNLIGNGQWLTIERARRGSRHHMIIINFSEQNHTEIIQLTEGNTNAVEILLSNIAQPGTTYETNALIKISEPIFLKPYEYLVLRWSPSIEGLGIIF